MLLRIVLLIGALGAGGVAAWLVVAARPEPVTKVVVQPGPATQDVLVAAGDLLPAQTLTKENLRWQPWPQNALNSVYLTKSSRPDAIDALAGAVIRNRMAAGEPIREENLTPRHAGYLATVLPAGKRAMAVRFRPRVRPADLSCQTTVSTFCTATARARSAIRSLAMFGSWPSIKWSTTRTKNENSKANVIGKTATLELDPSQAEILTAAQAAGTLSLSLRSAADNNDYHLSNRQAVRIIRAGHSEILNTPF